jgi:hypothetical protein
MFGVLITPVVLTIPIERRIPYLAIGTIKVRADEK